MQRPLTVHLYGIYKYGWASLSALLSKYLPLCIQSIAQIFNVYLPLSHSENCEDSSRDSCWASELPLPPPLGGAPGSSGLLRFHFPSNGRKGTGNGSCQGLPVNPQSLIMAQTPLEAVVFRGFRLDEHHPLPSSQQFFVTKLEPSRSKGRHGSSCIARRSAFPSARGPALGKQSHLPDC